VNMTSLVASYYQANGPLSSRIALGSIVQSMKLGQGNTSVVLRMNLDTNASMLPKPSYWTVNYRLKFGSVHYSFTSSTSTSVIEITGPFSTGEDQAFTQVATYTLLVVDAWAIGLDVTAVLKLLQERKIDRATRVPTENDHSKMLATIYALQGIGLFVFWPIAIYLRDSVVSEPPSEFPYGFHGAGGIAASFLIGTVFIISLIFLGTALGLLLRRPAARGVALLFSSVIVVAGLYFGFSFLTGAAVAQNLALAMLILATAIANLIVVYVLFWTRAPSSSPVLKQSVDTMSSSR